MIRVAICVSTDVMKNTILTCLHKNIRNFFFSHFSDNRGKYIIKYLNFSIYKVYFFLIVWFISVVLYLFAFLQCLKNSLSGG